MHRILELCQMPRRPSEVLELKEAGYTWAQRLDFDFGLLNFKNWYDALAQETMWVPASQDEHKGQREVQRYRTVESILEQYGSGALDIFEEAEDDVENLDELIRNAVEIGDATF